MLQYHLSTPNAIGQGNKYLPHYLIVQHADECSLLLCDSETSYIQDNLAKETQNRN